MCCDTSNFFITNMRISIAILLNDIQYCQPQFLRSTLIFYYVNWNHFKAFFLWYPSENKKKRSTIDFTIESIDRLQWINIMINEFYINIAFVFSFMYEKKKQFNISINNSNESLSVILNQCIHDLDNRSQIACCFKRE